jgi:putative membrane protein
MVQHGPGFAPIGFHLFGILALFVLMAGAGVVALIVWAVRASGRPAYPVAAPFVQAGAPPSQTPRENPLEILARRFASGEINAEEYQRARDLLGGGPKT